MVWKEVKADKAREEHGAGAVTLEDMTCLSSWPGSVRMAPAVYTMFWVFSLEHPLLAASVRDDSALINGNSK